jgi:hypothetical protein
MGATLEPGEPHYGNSNTVWWTWSPPSYAVYQFDTFGSSFDTYLAVFIGDVVTSLYTDARNDDALGTLQSAVCLESGPGTDFRIQVSGSKAGDVGTIALNWHRITVWSDWFYSHSYTDTYFDVEFGADLSVLSLWYMQAWKVYYRTNELGCEERRYESSCVYTNGITITDRNHNKRIDNKLPEGIGENFSFENYDGEQILVYDPDSKKLMAFKAKQDVFVKSNEQAIDDFGGAWFDGSEIHVFVYRDNMEGLRVFDKKLKKEKWTVPLAEGDIGTIGKGLIARTIWSNSSVAITCTKKGKKLVAQHFISNVVIGSTHIEHDSKGGVLYWTNKSGTNSPLTYVDKKGARIVDDQSLTDVGDVWSFESFDGKTLYVSKHVGDGTNVFYVYKVKGLANLGKKEVDCGAMLRAGRKAYIFSYCGAGSGLIVCDKKLKKEKWTEPQADGDIWRLRKEIFVRMTRSTAGDIVTETHKLFNRQGEIVTYTFNYPK